MLLELLRFLRDRSISLARSGREESGHLAPEGALERLETVANADPTARNFNDLGIANLDLGRMEAALAAFERAIAIDPGFSAAHFNSGNVLGELQRHEAAVARYDHAIALNPGSADAHIGRGNALSELGRQEAALESYSRAIALQAEYAEAHFNHGVTLRQLNRTPEALESLERAKRLNPELDYLYGMWLFNKMAVCDWRGIEGDFRSLDEKIERGESASAPFPVLITPSAPALQRKAAENWIRVRYPPVTVPTANAARPRPGKIRLGYFSADFHDHATARLVVELFELHDRSNFELIAFSFGAAKADAMRRRLHAACDDFIDVQSRTDAQVASTSREMGIDIALDLKGFSQESRTGIFALRAAPVQVNYLAYPGTMGAPYIDYLIADRILIPDEDRRHYTEKIACLPHSYQPNDTRRPAPGLGLTREKAGLPPAGFVFCCFNNNFKILPGMFDCWMRILGKVDGSVLWLLEDNAVASANLRVEAAARGVEASRLVFAPRVDLPDHMARHCIADLFLDTLPCNAHTTASDALWAGLPVLTYAGDSFAGRVAASLLNALRMPELIAPDISRYEGLAVSLAKDPDKLEVLRQALARNRLESPLFNTALYARHIEAAYTTMHERRILGLPPEHFHVRPIAGR